jgi:L-fuconolactonase
MPDFPIVDSHVHLWDPTNIRMPWLDGNATLNRPFGPSDYRQHTAGIDVEATVYLEVDVPPHYPLLEARWAIERAAEERRIRGIVAHAPVEYGEHVRIYLDELEEMGPLIKGARRLIQAEPDLQFATRPDFVRGVQVLAEYGFSFDICVYHPQLPAAVELVRQCPDTAFVLDHVGKPNIREHVLDPWRRHIAELASVPNVSCKISGLVTEADWESWTTEDLRPYVHHVIESFGEDRVMFGGDWPVVLNASGYPRWVATLDELTKDLSPEAKRKLWAENARRFYRLD